MLLQKFPSVSELLAFAGRVPVPLLRRTMASASSQAPAPAPRPDHLTSTALEEREAGVFRCRIDKIRPANQSKNVRLLSLTAVDPPTGFHYRAGQWVDCFLPGVPTVGGYSFVSSQHGSSALRAISDDLFPSSSDKQFTLAVKASRHPPAAWIHGDECKEGAEIHVRTGGSFHLQRLGIETEEGNVARDVEAIVCVAGGVGLNPLISFIASLSRHYESSTSVAPLPAISLLYSIRDWSEGILLKELVAIAKSRDVFPSGLFSLRLFLTREGDDASAALAAREIPGDSGVEVIRGRRLSALDLARAFSEGKSLFRKSQEVASAAQSSTGSCGASASARRTSLQGEGDLARKRDIATSVEGCRLLLCGPPAMTEEVTRWATELGLEDKVNAHSERWW